MNENPILVVAAHPDDEVLGCGGYMARMAAQGRPIHVLILADGEMARSGAKDSDVAGRRKAAEAAAEILGVASLEILGFPDNRLDSVDLLDIVQKIEACVRRVAPSTVLTHHHGDVNIDHRIAHEATITACRPLPGSLVKELLFFEVASSTEWRPRNGGASAFTPNVFVDITPYVERKRLALLAYEAELRSSPHPRSPDALDALAAWRGATVGVLRAEAFVLGRASW